MTSLDDALCSAYTEAMVTKWVVVAELMDESGARALSIVGSTGLACWERLGMLQVATARAHSNLAKGQP